MERHVEGKGSSFSSKYKLKRLVYFEEFQYVDDAIKREKQIKNWRRAWKINLIEKDNPNWDDLWRQLDSENKFRMTSDCFKVVKPYNGFFYPVYRYKRDLRFYFYLRLFPMVFF
tara:strand:- start:1571 stop:1912 length:342 start_codon:yes stop_codon:yes gene_type:complete